MVYLTVLLLAGLMVGLAAVASNPSPYFAALGLVGVAGLACGLLGGSGAGFLALILFLIYLGGMLVAFAYSAALSAEPYPEAWGDWPVLGVMVGYFGGMGLAVGYFWGVEYEGPLMTAAGGGEFNCLRTDTLGVAELYSSGGSLLVLGAWALLITLFVVLEVVRGGKKGGIRAL
uniref:NADH-ubiquinone oxidoreductase chain 6 n=1 Tax=Acanthemblemaria sp. AC-2023 TaxID=3028466 RepID=A0AA51X4D3_9TELE|nr:NADH dehydrogenase subunit 6 [Acanthemblemaria sp. AC-2023]